MLIPKNGTKVLLFSGLRKFPDVFFIYNVWQRVVNEIFFFNNFFDFPKRNKSFLTLSIMRNINEIFFFNNSFDEIGLFT